MKNKRIPKRFEDRNQRLLELGFKRYGDYLTSEMWKTIREMVFVEKGRKCFLCGTFASQIHHTRYEMDDLIGAELGFLQPICRECHNSLEFTDKGKRLSKTKSKKEFRRRLNLQNKS